MAKRYRMLEENRVDSESTRDEGSQGEEGADKCERQKETLGYF